MSAIKKAKENVMWGIETVCSRGYVLATGGNISSLVEGENKFVITPSSREYATMTIDDLAVLDMQGEVIEGKWKPSVEAPMHRLIYLNRPDVKCIIHEHSKFSIAAASMVGVTKIPAFSSEILGYFGGEIPLVPFAAPGDETAKLLVPIVSESNGAIMANHGAIGLGASMKDAMTNCDIIDKSCEIYLTILAAGKVKTIPAEVIKAMRESMEGNLG